MADIYSIIIDSYKFALVMLGALVFYGVIYSFTQQYLYSRMLTWLHIGLTVAAFLFLTSFPLYNAFRQIQDAGYASYTAPTDGQNRLKEITLLILVLTQFLYFINLITGLVHKCLPGNNQRMPHY